MIETTLLQTWYDEVWNNANESFINKMLHSGARIHGLKTDHAKSGSEAFLPFYKNFREQFPTVQVELEPIFSGEGFEAARCNVKATHASGKQVAFSGITIAKFADGKLVEGWNGFDFLDMYQQLGYKLVDENV